jgi:hypothetical protein
MRTAGEPWPFEVAEHTANCIACKNVTMQLQKIRESKKNSVSSSSNSPEVDSADDNSPTMEDAGGSRQVTILRIALFSAKKRFRLIFSTRIMYEILSTKY